MEIIEFTSSNAFNAIFTIYVHLTVLTAPLFASLGLFGK